MGRVLSLDLDEALIRDQLPGLSPGPMAAPLAQPSIAKVDQGNLLQLHLSFPRWLTFESTAALAP
jgi:hypothetical protein